MAGHRRGHGVFDAIDWGKMFLPDTPLLEIFLRGTVMYLALFALLRFVLRREAGALGITDLLVIVLIADAAQNGLADDYSSVTDGLLLVATIVGWSHFLNWLAYRFPLWRRVVLPTRVQLVRDGRLLRRNLDREMISEEELLGEIHGHGCEDLHEVRAAWIEADGMISVIRSDRGEGGGSRKKPAAA